VLPPSRKFLHFEARQLGLYGGQPVHEGRVRLVGRWRWLVRFTLPRQPCEQPEPRLVTRVCQPKAKA